MYCITRIISIRVRPVRIEWFPFSTLQLMSVSWNDKWKHGRTLLGLQVNWLKLCTKKKKLYSKAKKSGLQNDWKVYPVTNNFLKKACNLAQREHINKISEDLKSSGNPKPFRSFVSFVRKGSNELTAESGWCDPDGWPGHLGKHEFLFFNCVYFRRLWKFPWV